VSVTASLTADSRRTDCVSVYRFRYYGPW